MMFRSRGSEGDPAMVLNRGNAPKLLGSGAVTGLLSGFFGIGGGFLVVPGLIASTGLPILFAVGSSLLAVTALGLPPPFRYPSSRLGALSLPVAFLGGGAPGRPFGPPPAPPPADPPGGLP